MSAMGFKAKVDESPYLHALSPAHDGLFRFTFAATPANLSEASMIQILIQILAH